jgi:hypothetical protein
MAMSGSPTKQSENKGQTNPKSASSLIFHCLVLVRELGMEMMCMALVSHEICE